MFLGVSLRDENASWIKGFAKRIERNMGVNITTSMLTDIIFEEASRDEEGLMRTVVAIKHQRMKEKALQRYGKDLNNIYKDGKKRAKVI